MSIFWRLFDNLMIRAISITGIQVQGLVDYIEVECLHEYLDPESPHRRPRRRLRFALP